MEQLTAVAIAVLGLVCVVLCACVVLLVLCRPKPNHEQAMEIVHNHLAVYERGRGEATGERATQEMVVTEQDDPDAEALRSESDDRPVVIAEHRG